jgi:hypothetical protein
MNIKLIDVILVIILVFSILQINVIVTCIVLFVVISAKNLYDSCGWLLKIERDKGFTEEIFFYLRSSAKREKDKTIARFLASRVYENLTGEKQSREVNYRMFMNDITKNRAAFRMLFKEHNKGDPIPLRISIVKSS